MSRIIEDEDVTRLRGVLDRLRKFHGEWDGREDDPEDMLIEAPEMVYGLIQEMGPVMKRLEKQG